MNNYLQIQGVSKSFGSFAALRNIEIGIRQGEFVCLLGPSGCGKTTLLRILAGLETPEAGLITVNGRDITSLPPAQRNFGVVFQSYALFPNLTAYENIAYGLIGKGMTKQDIRSKVVEMLEMVGLAHVRDRYPAQLSGGQQQRVALARAIALSPEFLLLDEPLSALDAKVRHKLRQEICELQSRLGITTVMVTHDQEEALTMADRIIVMNHSQVIQIGSPEDIYDRPATPFVAQFIGTMNFIDQHPMAAGGTGLRKLSIRPEHIRIVPKATAGGIQVVLKHAEFHGSFYRVTVITLNNNVEVPGGQALEIDLPVKQFRNLKLQTGDKLTIEIPAEHVIAFEEEDRTSPVRLETIAAQ